MSATGNIIPIEAFDRIQVSQPSSVFLEWKYRSRIKLRTRYRRTCIVVLDSNIVGLLHRRIYEPFLSEILPRVR